jgi:nucleoside-diphosphate-sugar epimerase
MHRDKTILVTGGAGFIGSNLVDSLIASGHRVICFDNFDALYPRTVKEKNLSSASQSSLFTLVEGDIRDESALSQIFKEHAIDIVVHLAARVGIRPSIQDPRGYFDVNVNGTLNILEAMKNGGVKKLVFASSSSIYGNNKKTPYSESDIVDRPISPYAASKKSGELLTHAYHHLYDIDVINLRFFTVFGPRLRPDLAIHRFFKNLYADRPIDVFGDGSSSRDYTYVGDIISGITSAISYLNEGHGIYEIVNLGNHVPVRLSDLIALIESTSSRKFEINRLPMQPGDVDLTFADISKAKQMLGYNPNTSLSDGLSHFKDWFEANL